MTEGVSRRNFLSSLAATTALVLIEPSHADALRALISQEQPMASAVTLQAVTRTLEINGKPASVMGILQPNGVQGMTSVVDQPFHVLLENKLGIPTAIHWHGLHPPNNEDGVPGVTQPVIRPDASVMYDFPLIPAGTHWMHSHLDLQEAYLLAAPLIVHESADRGRDVQEIVVMLGDFSFIPPKEVYAKLQARAKSSSMSGIKSSSAPAMSGKSTAPSSSASSTKMAMNKPDANDWNYDAYLANDRTLSDPDVVKVEKNSRLRLRIINGASGTNYFIDLGHLTGELIATDGMPVKPVQGRRFPLAIAQRIDVLVQIPKDGGAFPILALREGAPEQTGVILATSGVAIKRLPEKNSTPAGLLTLDLESRLVALNPLSPKPASQPAVLRLQGNMATYQWMINDKVFDVNNPGTQSAQVLVKPRQRAVIKFINETGMSHPMHLHGHSFQVIAINDRAITGALRDTVLVTPRTSVTVAFDANNPGLWFVHCHVLWHLEAGMATLVQYQA